MTDETKPSSSPLVSIIVPVWNAKQYLDNCINSLRSQTYPNLEIILVDDGSTDGSSELCDAAMETDWRIHVIHQSDRGVSAARNAGLDAATGEFVAFVDSDDSLRREAVAESVRCAVTHSSDMVVFGYDVIEEHADGSVTKQESKTVRQGDVIDTRRRHEKIVADQLCALDNDELLYQCWGKLYRRSNISGLRFTDDVAFGEDTVFVLELLSHGVRLTFLQRCLYVYRQHADSLIRGFRPGKPRIWNTFTENTWRSIKTCQSVKRTGETCICAWRTMHYGRSMMPAGLQEQSTKRNCCVSCDMWRHRHTGTCICASSGMWPLTDQPKSHSL